jgi:hypothetical protein
MTAEYKTIDKSFMKFQLEIRCEATAPSFSLPSISREVRAMDYGHCSSLHLNI